MSHLCAALCFVCVDDVVTWGEVFKWVKILAEVQKKLVSGRESGLVHLLYPFICHMPL